MIPQSNFVSVSGVLTDGAYENIKNLLFLLTSGFLIIDMQHVFPKQMEIYRSNTVLSAPTYSVI